MQVASSQVRIVYQPEQGMHFSDLCYLKHSDFVGLSISGSGHIQYNHRISIFFKNGLVLI